MNAYETSRDPSSGSAPPPAAHQPPPGAGFMNVLRWVLFAALLVLAVGSITAYVLSRQPKNAATQHATKIIYQCPMHPSYTSDRPGECPICGMTLERVEIGGAGGAGTAAIHPGDVPGLASIDLDPDRVQLIGVRTARVQKRALGGRLELVGNVAPDDARLKRVQVRFSGWIRHLDISPTGASVTAGYPLFSIDSPELYQIEREYLIELGARDSTGSMSHEAGALSAARDRLRFMGVPRDEIERLELEHTASSHLLLRAPVSGAVVEHGVLDGQFVAADTPLFTVADLSNVWVLADVYEMDFSRVGLGDAATFTAEALPGRAFRSRVELVYPTVSSQTRTLKVRLNLSNRDGALRPGMFGRVTIDAQGASALVVPGEAIVNTGENTYVFLARAGGHFEPRLVTAGQRIGDEIQIVNGLAEGDTVVSSAAFLIDSESRLKAAIAGMGVQPSTGHAHGGAP